MATLNSLALVGIPQGAKTLVVKSGGSIDIQSGGSLNAGGGLTCTGDIALTGAVDMKSGATIGTVATPANFDATVIMKIDGVDYKLYLTEV